MSLNKDLRILVVEDNGNIRKLLMNILKSMGFNNLTEADNGLAAWEKIQGAKFDLVMTDWMMPEMDGLELLKKIRNESDELKEIPILMITATDKQEDVAEAAKSGVSGYIVKPFSVKTILAKINEVTV